MYLYEDAVIGIRAAVNALNSMLGERIVHASVHVMKASVSGNVKVKDPEARAEVHISKDMREAELKDRVEKFRAKLIDMLDK